MNGRLQRWRLFARCGLALLALAVWGWLPALLIVLSSECVVIAALLLRQAGEPQPLRELLAAAWRECWQSELVFSFWQPFAEHREPDHLPTSTTGHAGLLLLHGFHCNRGIWIDWMRWSRKRDVACVALSLEPADGSIDDYVPAIEAAVQQLTALTGQPPLILAHSMGGLAARAWWRAHGQAGRVRGLITLGSPHAGTPMAHFAAALNARQMRPAGEWLRALSEAELSRPLPPTYCVSAGSDQIVFPTKSTQLPGAVQLLDLPATGHLGLVFHPAVRVLVARLLGKVTDEAQASTASTPRRI